MKARKPLIHFFLIGGLLFAGAQLTDNARALGFGRDTIEIATADVDALREQWLRDMRREPEPAQLRAGLRRLADEEMLYREALRLGLDRSDPVIRGRLVQNMRFTDPETVASEPVLLQSARALGMQRSDLVVRRRLVQLLENRLQRDVHISEADLQSYVAQHPERYQPPPRVRYTQVFVSADLHHGDLAQMATHLREQLDALSADAGVEGYGDHFLLGSQFQYSGEKEIASRFGLEFAAAAMTQPVGAWNGPYRSVYGLHFLRVDQRAAAAPADYVKLRPQAYYALLEQRRQQALREAITALRQHYPLQIDAVLLAPRRAS